MGNRDHGEMRRKIARNATSVALSVILAAGLFPTPALAEIVDEAMPVSQPEAMWIAEEVPTSRLNDLAVSAEVVGAVMDGGTYVVQTDTEYDVRVTFAERDDLRLEYGDELEYLLPGGFEPAEEQAALAKPLSFTYFGEDGLQYEFQLDDYEATLSDGTLRLRLTRDEDVEALRALGGVGFEIGLTGTFLPDTFEVWFAEEPTSLLVEPAIGDDTAGQDVVTSDADPQDVVTPDVGPVPVLPEPTDRGDGWQAVGDDDGAVPEVSSTDPVESDVWQDPVDDVPTGTPVEESVVQGDDVAPEQLAQETVVVSDEEEPRTRSEYVYEDARVRVVVTLADPTHLPDTAELVVTEVRPWSSGYDYDSYMDALDATGDAEHTEDNTILYDVRFVVGGEEVEPAGPVAVSFSFRSRQLEDGIDAGTLGEVEVTHLPEADGGVSAEPVEADVSVAGERADFVSESFSVYAFSYTVDFELGGYTYTLPGEGTVALSSLMFALGIPATVSQVRDVSFSDPTLVSVARDLSGADWTLRSLAPFSTAETLSIELAGGLRYVVDVTDAQLAVTRQPMNVSATAGQTAYFSVDATGTGLSYRWQVRLAGSSSWQDTSLEGCDTPELVVAATTDRSGRAFRCVVSSSAGGSVTSDAATLTVVAAPRITGQPSSVSAGVGQVASFGVVATGAGLTYRWQTLVPGRSAWQDTNFSGHDTKTLSFAVASTYDGRQYRCIVTDKNGYEVTSSAATLTVTGANGVYLDVQPADVSASAGQTAAFSVGATGTGLTYQWQTQLVGSSTWQNTNLGGSKTNTLSFVAGVGQTGRRYRCLVTTSGGVTLTSDAATLTVIAAPVITSQPASTTVSEGATAKFSVSATGTGISYRWQTLVLGGAAWQDTKLAGYDTRNLSVAASSDRSGRKFRCVVTDKNGCEVTSSEARLTVVAKPSLTRQPTDASVTEGQTAPFSVDATGTGLSYQWQVQLVGSTAWQDTKLDGYDTSELRVSATTDRSGRKFRCVVTDRCGAKVTSSAAALTVTARPRITKQPTGVTVEQNGTATFTVMATGTGLTYKWQTQLVGKASWQDTALAGFATNRLSFKAAIGQTGRRFRCVVTDRNGASVTSDPALLTVKQPDGPRITRQPAGVSATEGQETTFSVAATGIGLTYQWQTQQVGSSTWQKTTLDGANTPTLRVGATTSRSGRKYRCIVTDASGNSTNSSAATLTVVAAPRISSQPSSATAVPGDTAAFAVTATGSGLSYRWQTLVPGRAAWQDTTLAGFNTRRLSVAASLDRSGRKFRCVVTDKNGFEVTSAAATLTVREPVDGPAVTRQPADVTVNEMGEASFSVEADGDGLSYRWQTQTSGSGTWQDTSLEGYATDTLRFNAPLSRDGRRYRCRVTNADGGVTTSEAATLTVVGAQAAHTGALTAEVTDSMPGGRVRYRFVPPAAGTYYFESLSYDHDPHAHLYDASGAQLAENDDYSGLGFLIGRTLSAGATYYPEARFHSYGDTGAMTLSLSKGASLGSQTAEVAEAGRRCRLRFAPQESGTYVIESTGSDDTYVHLLGPTGEQLAYNDDSGNGQNFRLEAELEAGTVYYYEVRYYSSTSTGTIPVSITKAESGETTYRALLVGEVSFYDAENEKYDICTRNWGDVNNMRNMLSSVTGPDGGSYAVTYAQDLSPYGIRDAIASTFADADDDDVSLFFVATHGNVDTSSGGYAGALSTAASDEGRQYWIDDYSWYDISDRVVFDELAAWLGAVPGKVIVMVESCGSGSAIYEAGIAENLSWASVGNAADVEEPELFNRRLVQAFASRESVANTGELRQEGKFYVLTASRHQEISYGTETGDAATSGNVFTQLLCEGVGTSGSPPADSTYYAYDGSTRYGNSNGLVELEELFAYISACGDDLPCGSNGSSRQHVQRYPVGSDYGLFARA